MSIISRFSIFKKTEHRKFDPIPRFYNPDKEYIEDKLAKKFNSEESKYNNIRSNIRSNFRNNKAGFGLTKNSNRRGRSSNIRLIVILVLLLVITYYLMMKYLINSDLFLN